MAARVLSWIVFVVLMTAIVLGSIVVVLCLYLPWVALKAVLQMLRGKEKIKSGTGVSDSPTLHVG